MGRRGPSAWKSEKMPEEERPAVLETTISALITRHTVISEQG